jgi:hypothetical protein
MNRIVKRIFSSRAQVYIKIGRRLLLIFIGLNVAACHSKSTISEIKRAGLTLQVLSLPVDDGDAGALNFAARLVPDKGLLESRGRTATTALWYHMDSCFFLQVGRQKVYAAMVQPIANGIPGKLEYLLAFEPADLQRANWQLTYQDQYFNHQKYTIYLHRR